MVIELNGDLLFAGTESMVRELSGLDDDVDFVILDLRRVDEADIQVRADHRRVKVTVLDGAKHDDVWKNVVLAEAPEVEKYERRAGRTIPVARLEPIG